MIVLGLNYAPRTAVVVSVEPLLSTEGLKLWAAVEDHHESARSHLVAPSGATLAGVVWLSAHLSAIEHTIYHALPPGPASRDAVRADQQTTNDLKRALRLLERQLSGESTAPTASRFAGTALMDALDAHARTELAIVRTLDGSLMPDQMSSLLTRYRDAIQHGPTRPHPHGRHTGAIEPFMFALNSASDRIMDTVDARPSPLPRPPGTPRRVGKWSLYLLGVPAATDHAQAPPDFPRDLGSSD
jgi:hypothetical protein